MTLPTKLVLFGDQTVDPCPIIKQLCRQSRESVTLQVFFRNTYNAVRQEIALSEKPDRSLFPSFDSILSLAETYSKSNSPEEAVTTVLLCIAQLGLILIRGENDDSAFEANPSSTTYFVGLCTGMLPAAAMAVSNTTGQLLSLAPEIVRVSLRLGLEAGRRSDQIEKSRESWATIVPGIAPFEQQEALDQFHQTHMMATSKTAYISALSDSTATISGPPSTLASLFAFSGPLKKARRVKLPITAAFHAPHLGTPDIERIIGPLSNSDEHYLRKDVAILSTRSGEPIAARTLGEALQHIVLDILQEPLSWPKIVQNILSNLAGQDVVLTSTGPVRAADGLRQKLTSAGINVVESTELQPLRALQPENRSSDIAIVGYAARLPESETLEDVWKILEDGRDVHKKIPRDRFDVDTHCDPSGKIKNTSYTPYGCFVDRPGFFDARLFNMSPREAAQTDPAQRLLLLTTYEALEMAGYTPDGTPSTAGDRIGTFFGQTLDDYRDANASQNIEMYYVSGGIRAFGPGRLNYHFKWEGPSYCVDAACSSSTLSIQMAMSSLRSHECDTAVAGGTNVLTGVDMFSGLSRGSFLSPTGSCKTFDNDADGYCRGDGVGSVILKRLDDAMAEGDNIQAVIRSAATNHSAYAVSITHPHAGAQQKLMRQVLREADVEPSEIDYVEMHGTGTQAGDATEFTSVTNVLAGRTKENPLHVGAVKANFGHAEAAAGTNSLVKILMMMRKNAIPPHVGIKGRINEKFPPLDKINVRINRKMTPFKARSGGDGKRRVLLNNFNATGGNTSLLIEDAPKAMRKGLDPRTAYVVAVSAKTSTSFKQNTQRLLEYIESNPETQLQDLSYTTTARRMHHVIRKAYATENIDQLTQSMRKDLASSSEPTATTEVSSAVFLFTGQGSQYLGMGRQLFQTNSTFRKSIWDFDSICVQQGLPSFKWTITADASDDRLPSPSESQLALVSVALALASLWKSWGIAPKAVIGHSLGEYAALCVAGVLSVSDTLYLVGKRAELMEKKCIANSHAMLAVQSGAEPIEQIMSCGQMPSCEIACLNGPSNTVVSGALNDISLLEEKLSAAGVKKTLLKLPFAFHSVQMDPILDDIRLLAQNVEFCKPTVPVASTLLGSLVRDEGIFSPDYLAKQARRPVKFQGALQTCKAEGIARDESLWIEIGPHPLCHGMVRSTLGLSPTKALPSLKRDEDCWSTISKSMANAYDSGVRVNWVDYHRDFQSALRLLELPSYAFDLKNYWIQHEGDWSLRKGETASTAAATSPPKTAFSTTCLQQVENELFTNDSASVTFSSQLSEPKLNIAVRGHLVNGTGLCPSSVYADVAFTAAWYIASRMTPSDPVPAMDLSTMEVFRPLIVDSDQTSQLLKVSASRNSNEKAVNIIISSQDENGRQEHAHCTVMYGDGQQWMDEWQRNAYLIQSRIDKLIEPTNSAGTHRMLKDMIYKQFQTVVTYSKEYHNIDELFMDCELNETAANIRFQSTAGNGQFVYSPYWIDTVAHLAGFILNANVNTPADTVFISHGWESFRIAAPLSHEKAYRGYVRMQPTGSRGVQAGDVYIFDGDEIVVVCKGIKFQQMKRTTLQSLLGTSQQASVAPKPVAAKASRQRPAITRKAAVAPVAQSSGGGFSKILETIASEVGVEVSELSDDVKISDVGVDSLLTISILGRLRPETGLDLPSSLFIEYPTVAQLKAFFLDKMTLTQIPVDSYDSDSSSENESPGFSRSQSNSTISTPEEPDVVAILMSIIAREVGIEESEIQPSTPVAEIGVDSLLTISILDAFQTEIGMNLSANFFHENPTFADVQKALGVPASPQKSLDLPLARIEKNAEPSKPTFRSKSVLLQGRPQKGRQALFLLPDGAGSLFSYISLPALPSGVPVYGLDSPFHNSPIDYTISFEEVAAIYIEEIRKIQPHGPYMLGGWSLGGIHAYETSRQLIAQGETITNLIMIDSPCPGTLPPLPSPTLNLLEKAGVFDGLSSSGGPITERTRLHFLGSVRALEHYTATPLPAGKSPGKVTVIWAQEGVLEGREEQGKEYMAATSSGDINADMDKAKQWLTGKRDSFGPSGWDKLTGTEVACHVVGGNHFSIMFPPKIAAVAAAVATGLPSE